MKRIVTLILALGVFALCLYGCGKKNGEGKRVFGELAHAGQTEAEMTEKHQSFFGNYGSFMFFDDLTSILQALQSGRIYGTAFPECVADYIVYKNNSIKKLKREDIKIEGKTVERTIEVSLGMAVKENETELLASLNSAIAALKADGTIDVLHKQYSTAAIDAVPAELPKIDGAKTVKVVVTGDLPPLDFITADGKPAGFNVALLSAISNKAGINFELVTSNAASRTAMLSSGKADAVFWMRTSKVKDKDGKIIMEESETPAGIVLTEIYLAEIMTPVEKK